MNKCNIKAKIKIDDDIVYKGRVPTFDDLKGIMDSLKIKYEGTGKKKKGGF